MPIFLRAVTPDPNPQEPPVKQPPLIFGREPAVYVGLVEAVLTVLLAFGLGITQTSYAPWVALVVALGGAYTAWATKDTMLGVALAVVKALIVLVTVYGLTLTDAQTGAIIGAVSIVIGFFQRTQTSPAVARPYITGPVSPSA